MYLKNNFQNIKKMSNIIGKPFLTNKKRFKTA